MFIVLRQAELSKLSPLGKTISSDGNQETDHEQILIGAYRYYGDALVGSLTTSNCRLVRLLPGVSDNSKRQIPKNNIAPRQRDGMLMSNEQWLHQVYQPVNHLLSQILSSLDAQIEPRLTFDDELLEEFQAYLKPVETGSGRKLLFVPCLIHPV